MASYKGVEQLEAGYRISADELRSTLDAQRVELRRGDVVLVRTGRMINFDDTQAYLDNPPGIGLEAARFLAEESGAMIIGADNLSLDAFPSTLDDNYIPVHTYLLAERGVPIMELVYLEDLAADNVHEFVTVAASNLIFFSAIPHVGASFVALAIACPPLLT